MLVKKFSSRSVVLALAFFLVIAAGAFVADRASASALGLFAPAEPMNVVEPASPLLLTTVLSDDFEGPTTFVAANSTVNAWVIGTATNNGGSNGAYISNDGGVTNAYTLTDASTNHLYAPITVPPGESAIVLSFDWRAVGEFDATTADWDYLRVSVSSTIPIAGSFPALADQLPVRYSGQDNYTRAYVNLPASIADGVTRYLIFTWRNDASLGNQTPAAIDNVLVTSEVPTPISGTKTIPGDYPSIGSAFAHLNAHGADTSSGSVIFNVAAGSNFIETPGVLTASGSSATNRIVFRKAGIGANPVVTAEGSGNFGRPSTGSVTGTSDAVIALDGADFVTFDGIDVASSSVFATTPFCNIEYGYLIRNNTILANVITPNGSQNNIVRNANITMDRRKTTTIGILQTASTTTGAGSAATSAATANSGNLYQNLSIQNVYAGIYLLGTAAFPDTGVQIGNTSPTSFNSIGSAAANDIGNGAAQTWGIRAANQSGITISNNEVRNVTVTGAFQNDGIFLEAFQGVNEVKNNIVYNIRNASTSATNPVSGIRATHATTGTHTARIFNNFVHGITSGYTGAASATRQIRGIFIAGTGGGTSQDYEIANNSVRIDGSGSPNISSAAFEISTTSGPIYRVRNNIFSNFTGAQTSPAAHYSWVSTSNTTIGPAGSISNFNDLFISNPTQGFIGRGSSLDFATLAAWQSAMTQDASSISANPSFASATDLHLTGASPAIDTGTTLGPITTDIDNETRPNGPAYDIGADEFYPAPGNFQFSATAYSGIEGSAANLVINRVGGSSGPVTVDITFADVTATGGPLCGGPDYINFGGTVTVPFADGQTTATFGVPLCTDPISPEPPETFTATLNNPTGGAGLGSPTTATVTINDLPPPFAGTYTVGTSGTYPSLTNPGGIFEAINLAGTSGPVTIEIVSDLPGETGTHPLNQHPHPITVKSNGPLHTVSGNAAAGMIRLNGADNVTFDGTVGGSGMFLRFRNINTSAPTFVFVNDATSNIIRNSFVESANTSTTSGTIVFSTSTGTLGNSNNSIIDSHIRDRSDASGVPANAVYSSGSASAPNSANTISGCEVFNFTNSGVLVSATGAGNGWVINPSSFYQTASRTTPLTGISIQGGSGHSIINNSIGGSAPGAGGAHLATSSTFRGIDLTVGTLTPTSVQGNVIRNIRSTVTGFTASYGIFVQAGRVDLGTVTGNTIGSSVFAERFEINGDSYGIRVISTSTVNVVNNTVRNFQTTSSPSTGQFYFGMSIEGTGGTHTVLNNTIRDVSNASVPDGTFSTQTIGLLVLATGVQTVRGNTILNIGSTSTTAPTANNNRIWGAILSGTAVGTVFEKNRISNIFGSSAGTGARADIITGLQSQSSANGTYSNNMIETDGGASPSQRSIFGVLDLSAGPAASNYYFNSVNVYGTAAGANNTYAFNRNNTAVVNLRNNIFSNKRSGGTGFHVAIANTNASPSGWSSSASDFNLLFNVDNSHIAQWLGSAGTNNRTLAVFQTDTGGDANSFIGNPLFVSDSDLHLQASSPAINAGIPISGITDDIDNDTRPQGPAYDIGADEFVLATYTVGGTVSGLVGTGLVLQNNGGDNLTITANGPFTFATALPDLSPYNVTVLTQPTGPAQVCTVTNGSGTISGANVTNVQVTCVTVQWPLTVSLAGTGSGTVTSSPAGISCPGTCTANFNDSTLVTLTPTASIGSVFAGWSGDCTGMGPCTVNMTAARNVTATFNLLPQVQFAATTFQDDESQSATITVTRSVDLTGVSSVDVTLTDNTATGGAACTSGVDYINPGTVTLNFGIGVSSQSFNVTLCGDTLNEPLETVDLALTNPVNAFIVPPSTAVLNINDTANQWRNPGVITINDGGIAGPYPSTITVTGAPTSIGSIRVTLYDVYHNFPDDINVLLVHPDGVRTYVLMADAGGPAPGIPNTAPVTLTFSDLPNPVVPDSTAPTTGKYLPTTWEPVGSFPGGAPPAPYPTPGNAPVSGRTVVNTLFGAFGLSDGNGVWSLYIVDDDGVAAPFGPESVGGEVLGGWGIELLPPTNTAVTVSGRVMTPDGVGLRNAVVTMTDSFGIVRQVTTSSLGYYTFADVPVGETYVMSVSSRRYRFTPRLVPVVDTLTDVDFIGQE